jgi:hypothetical protein
MITAGAAGRRDEGHEHPMNERFAQRVSDPKVASDTRTVADFMRIHCEGNHASAPRVVVETDAAQLGVYGRNVPALCAECAVHLAYAEKRRAYCSKDPKPFCAHCDSQCYSADELEWQRRMMHYSGPRSWYQGHAVAGIKHGLEALKYRKHAQANAQAAVHPAAAKEEEK